MHLLGNVSTVLAFPNTFLVYWYMERCDWQPWITDKPQHNWTTSHQFVKAAFRWSLKSEDYDSSTLRNAFPRTDGGYAGWRAVKYEYKCLSHFSLFPLPLPTYLPVRRAICRLPWWGAQRRWRLGTRWWRLGSTPGGQCRVSPGRLLERELLLLREILLLKHFLLPFSESVKLLRCCVVQQGLAGDFKCVLLRSWLRCLTQGCPAG